MHIVISDDHQDCIRHLSCFEKLQGHTVEIFNNSVSGTDALAERYKDAEAIVLIRERTVITRELLDRLPKLKGHCGDGRQGFWGCYCRVKYVTDPSCIT